MSKASQRIRGRCLAIAAVTAGVSWLSTGPALARDVTATTGCDAPARTHMARQVSLAPPVGLLSIADTAGAAAARGIPSLPGRSGSAALDQLLGPQGKARALPGTKDLLPPLPGGKGGPPVLPDARSLLPDAKPLGALTPITQQAPARLPLSAQADPSASGTVPQPPMVPSVPLLDIAPIKAAAPEPRCAPAAQRRGTDAGAVAPQPGSADENRPAAQQAPAADGRRPAQAVPRPATGEGTVAKPRAGVKTGKAAPGTNTGKAVPGKKAGPVKDAAKAHPSGKMGHPGHHAKPATASTAERPSRLQAHPAAPAPHKKQGHLPVHKKDLVPGHKKHGLVPGKKQGHVKAEAKKVKGKALNGMPHRKAERAGAPALQGKPQQSRVQHQTQPLPRIVDMPGDITAPALATTGAVTRLANTGKGLLP